MNKLLLASAIAAFSSAANAAPYEITLYNNSGTVPLKFCADSSQVSSAYSGFIARNVLSGACSSTTPPGNIVPPGRATVSNIGYVPGTGTPRYNVDITKYDNVFGHASSTDTLVTFPGRATSAPTIIQFPMGGYVALEFTVPATINPTTWGQISLQDYNQGTQVVSTISTSPGDFSITSGWCASTIGQGAPLPRWSVNGRYCALVPGHTYYLNIKPLSPGKGTVTVGFVNNVSN